MPAIIKNDTQRTKLFEGIILPQPPNEVLSPQMQKYLRDLSDYIKRLAEQVGQALGSLADVQFSNGTFITNVQYDLTSHQFQKKTQAGLIGTLGTESGWSTWETAEPCAVVSSSADVSAEAMLLGGL